MYLIYQSSALSSNAKDSYALFTISVATFYGVQTESETNQNWSISSSATPLKVGNLKCAAISPFGGVGGMGEFLPLCYLGGSVAEGSCAASSCNGL